MFPLRKLLSNLGTRNKLDFSHLDQVYLNNESRFGSYMAVFEGTHL